ncbi:MAG: hypothetical protein HFH15_13695 [Ruminococcus sp.]|jgi:O-methyltransferase|nr:hypothetical protein [Ruminococcus sp.]
MDYLKKASRVIGRLIEEGKTQFIIYPFGARGMTTKQVLNQFYGIQEEYIVDNKLAAVSKNKKIIDIETLKKVDIKNAVVLLSSDHEEIYNELRHQIFQAVAREKIVDVYSHSMYYDPYVLFEHKNFNDDRIAALDFAARQIYYNHAEGALAEVGVYKGDFSKYMSRFMPDRKLYLFDTFDGFHDNDITEQEECYTHDFRERVNFKDTSVEIALKNIGLYVNTEVRKGYFPETAQGLDMEKFAFVSLDTDLYKPTLAGLEFFWPRMSKGGFIFIHDFGLKGVEHAVMEYCTREKIGFVRLPDYCRSVVLAKPL